MEKTYLAKDLIFWASQPVHNELLFDKIFKRDYRKLLDHKYDVPTHKNILKNNSQ